MQGAQRANILLANILLHGASCPLLPQALEGFLSNMQHSKSIGIVFHVGHLFGVYLSGSVPNVPTRWVVGGRRHCCLICTTVCPVGRGLAQGFGGWLC